MHKALVLLLSLSLLSLTSCRWSDSVQPYCPAAEAAVGLICGGIVPTLVGDPETGDFEGVTTPSKATCIVLTEGELQSLEYCVD